VDAFAIVRPGKREIEIASRAEKARIPVAFVLPDIEFDSGLVLLANNTQGGRLAGEHLLSLGHREFAFLGGPSDSVDTLNRLEGLKQALRAAGVTLADERVRFMPTYELANGEVAAKEFLASEELRKATAIVLGCDALALGFMHRIKRSGYSIPEDVSVIGFDGVPTGELSHPRLSTVMQPTPLMGEQAASHLLTQRHLPRPPKRTVGYDFELIVRESTGPARSGPLSIKSRK
jgi:DNA-binding LacI/PurR family transcriptional regulator